MPLSWTNITHAVAGCPRSVRAAPIVGGNETLREPTTGERPLMELRPRHKLASFIGGEACHDPVDEIPRNIGVDACVLGWNGSAKRFGNDCSEQEQGILRQHGEKLERSF